MAVLLILGILCIICAVGLAVVALMTDGNENAAPAAPKGREGKNGGCYILSVEGMHCAHCKAAIEDALNAYEGVLADADFETGIVSVRYEGCPPLGLLDTLKDEIELAGYSVSDVRNADE